MAKNLEELDLEGEDSTDHPTYGISHTVYDYLYNKKMKLFELVEYNLTIETKSFNINVINTYDSEHRAFHELTKILTDQFVKSKKKEK